MVALPGLPEKGDVSDWLDAGTGTVDDLVQLGSTAPEWQPTADADPGAIDHQPLTDLGNAERLIARHGANLRYVHAWKAWIVWDGTRWVRDATGQVYRLAANTIRELTNVASADRSPDMPSQRRAELVKHAQRSENRQRLEACIAIAQNLDGVPISADVLDTQWWALNVATGTVDLRTGLIAPHRREDCLTRMVTYRGTRSRGYQAHTTGHGRRCSSRFLSASCPTLRRVNSSKGHWGTRSLAARASVAYLSATASGATARRRCSNWYAT